MNQLLLPEADEAAWEGIAAVSEADSALYLELDGWEGPLDLLLDLARRQKVDLKRISILDLVDQYLSYIERAESLRLNHCGSHAPRSRGTWHPLTMPPAKSQILTRSSTVPPTRA